MIELVQATIEGFLQPLIWNFILSQFSLGKLIGCTAVGSWGLFWFDDDGVMIEKCLNTGAVGAKAEFYESA